MCAGARDRAFGRFRGRDQDRQGQTEERRSEPAASIYEPVENPFTRDNNRGARGLKPRRPRRENGQAGDTDARSPVSNDDAAPAQLDLAVLPPSISPREEPAAAEVGAEPVAEAKPKRRAPRRKPAADDGEPLQAAS